MTADAMLTVNDETVGKLGIYKMEGRFIIISEVITVSEVDRMKKSNVSEFVVSR
jgi:hypothetical protein